MYQRPVLRPEYLWLAPAPQYLNSRRTSVDRYLAGAAVYLVVLPPQTGVQVGIRQVRVQGER